MDGYGVQTLALDLGAGQKRTSVLVDLIGGSGTLAGRVIDAQGNPLGGVLVKATSGTFAVETQSLTGGTIGAYSLTGLKTPGIYAISFSRDGYGTETRQLDLSTSGRATGFDVALSPSLGELAGVFKRAGVETGGVAVTVSDGATARSTATASSPAGAFRMGGLAPGSYTVTFQIPNRAPYTMLVTVDAGRTTTLNPDVDALPPPTTTTTTTTTTTP